MDRIEWEDKYYNTPDAKERGKLLEERLSSEGPSEELELIRKLYDHRYKPVKKEPERIDHMLRGMMTLKLLRNQRGLFGSYPKKEVNAALTDLGKGIVDPYKETGRRIWYQECKHLAKMFLNINLGDRAYTSLIWGFGELKDKTVRTKLARDIYYAAYYVPTELKITEELEVFTAAVTAAYEESFPEDKEILQSVIREGKK